MSDSHHYNLPLIKLHLFTWGVGEAWMEAKAYGGERADVFGVFSRNSVAWCDEYGQEVLAERGQTLVCEYKETVADLRTDLAKPWRQAGALALGDWRFYWMRADGTVRPEHVPESTGWGVVVFDDAQAQVVRPPARFIRVSRWETVDLAITSVQREMQAEMARLRQELAGQVLAPAQAMLSRKGGTGPANTRYTCRITEAAESYIAQGGPATTAELKRHLEQSVGWSGSPAKLLKHLQTRSNALIAPEPGGLWRIKDL